jgi:hypothetical protein
MSLLSLVLTLIVVGVLLWALNTYVPMDGKIKNLINIIVIICVVVYVISAFGLFHHMDAVRVPQVR